VKCGTKFQAAPAAGSGQPAPPVVTPSGWPAPPANISSYAVPAQPYTGPTQTSGKAIGSLICGIFFLLFPVAVAAVVLGHLSLSDIRKAAGRLAGRGLATTGLVLGYLGLSFIPILVIAAIAIPNLLRARMATNEASAVESLRVITVANVTYSSLYSNNFSPSLETLGGATSETANCNHALLIDSVLASGIKNGYMFSYTPLPQADLAVPSLSPQAVTKGCKTPGPAHFAISADPVGRGTTGQRSFYVDQSATIRVNSSDAAGPDSPPLE
jgi:type IV pilus assembly protein PilA